MSLREILGCDEWEPPESRLQRATFLDLLSAQSRAQLEQWKGNAAASGALSLLSDEAVNRDLEHRFLLQEKLLMYRGLPCRLIYRIRAEQRSVRRRKSQGTEPYFRRVPGLD